MDKRYVFVIDTFRCVGCRSCMVSCKMENLVSDKEFRIKVYNKDESFINDLPQGTYPNLHESWLPVPCQHCDNPPCVTVCPTGASYQTENGLTLVDDSKCIGCNYCIWACPYHARYFNEEKKSVDKCTMCIHRLEKDETPMCVSLCSGRALHVGDINDTDSEVYNLVNNNESRKLIPEKGTKPACYYI